VSDVKRRKPQVPKSLHGEGIGLWRSISSKFQLRPDEYARLEAAAKVADMLGLLESQWVERGSPMVTKGSMGQEVIHPLIGEIRQQRMSFAALLAGLKLPDEVEDGGAVPNQHRQAIQARWAKTPRGA
jgi:hypothetical protein